MVLWLHTKATDCYSRLHQILSMSAQDKVQRFDATSFLRNKNQAEKEKNLAFSLPWYIQNPLPRRQGKSFGFLLSIRSAYKK